MEEEEGALGGGGYIERDILAEDIIRVSGSCR